MCGRSVKAHDDLRAAYRTFRRTGVRRLPVLAAGRVVGVVTVDDLFLDVFRRPADLRRPGDPREPAPFQ
ncbi:CBS domain-containing protein [Streptomyces sp. NPDC020192]|uniref:CBS domain-containing protein n=1 Tax=Streptomyces sp. NPDC020192 TaxID=3365066 RepID=UPI0037AEB532